MTHAQNEESIVLSQFTIDYEIVFVKQPEPQPPYKVKWKARIGNHEFDYFTGIGHIVNYKDHRTTDRLNQLETLLRTGKPRHFSRGDKPLQLSQPKLDDVVYCLLTDSEVLHYACFEDWCGNFGYNSDSISDKKVYDACFSNALKLSSVLDIEKLRPLFVDY
jgi:hypothetical protein